MASARLAELLRSTSELTEEEINELTENDAWKLIHTNENRREKSPDNAQEFERPR